MSSVSTHKLQRLRGPWRPVVTNVGSTPDCDLCRREAREAVRLRAEVFEQRSCWPTSESHAASMTFGGRVVRGSTRLDRNHHSGSLAYRASVAQWKAELMARRPKPAKLAVNAALREYVADRLAGMIRLAYGSPASGPSAPQWRGAIRGGDRTGDGLRPGVPSRLPTGCRSISPMMDPCASSTRRSTGRCTSRGVALCVESWWRA